MFFTEPEQFVFEGLPALINGTSKLHLLLATYNTVNGYDGEVETGKDGLSIRVQSGHLKYSPMILPGLMVPDPTINRLASRAMREEGVEAQRELASSLVVDVPQDASFIAIIYAGLSAFDEAVNMAHKIKNEHTAAKVVITTCDCDIEKKTHVLNFMLEKREIDAVVTTWECGGRQPMADILEGFLEVWPSN